MATDDPGGGKRANQSRVTAVEHAGRRGGLALARLGFRLGSLVRFDSLLAWICGAFNSCRSKTPAFLRANRGDTINRRGPVERYAMGFDHDSTFAPAVDFVGRGDADGDHRHSFWKGIAPHRMNTVTLLSTRRKSRSTENKVEGCIGYVLCFPILPIFCPDRVRRPIRVE